MDINVVNLIFFSPTRTTARVLEGIAQGIGAGTVERIDLTRPEGSARETEDLGGELAIIGAPVYGGRIPEVAARRLRRIRATGMPAAVVAVYGNRAYEDALLELRETAIETGFRPIAAGAFVGEHSYDSAATPIATGRPDEKDLGKARALGEAIRDKMEELGSFEETPTLQVPGNFPYKEQFRGLECCPTTEEALCTKCGECAAACPTAAISVEDTVATDQDLCIACSACVKICPSGARVWDHPRIAQISEWLSTEFGERREPEVYV